MPKDRKRNSLGKHAPSARLASRSFTNSSGKSDHVELGSMAGASADEILATISKSTEAQPVATITKKEKQQLKHQAFIDRLASTATPYSKSHNRRLKKKARDQLSTNLQEVRVAIDDIEDDDEGIQGEPSLQDDAKVVDIPMKPKPKPGQIGPSKGSTLTVAQRKRVLETERQRQPRIMSNPAFASNPFETIRTHAQNTLIKHTPPSQSSS